MNKSCITANGDKLKLAELLEQAARLSDEMDLWFSCGQATGSEHFNELAAWLRKIGQ